MKDIALGVRKMVREEKGLIGLIILLFFMGIFLGLYTLLNFKAGGTTMYIGYSDIGPFDGENWLSLWSSGGYRTGGWFQISIFPILGLSVGVLHNLFAIQAFERRGKGYALTVIFSSMVLLVGAFIVLLRLLGKI